MRLLATAAISSAVVLAQAQGFVATVSGYGEFPGYLRLMDVQGEGLVWEFDIKGREGMFRILEQIHQVGDQRYEVKWGERDTLRVKAVTHSPATGEAKEFEWMLRNLLNAVRMTYRVEGGQYNVMPRPHASGGGIDRDWEESGGSTSLDHIARALSLQGRGYRVDRVPGREVALVAPVASWSQLVWVVSELDPGIKIVDDGSVVMVSRRWPAYATPAGVVR